ncbi:MAG: hypothetical protein GX046_04900, partial [Tissierellia bacterium]|nr:hypothetical protein [Tissierellia bacterium]
FLLAPLVYFLPRFFGLQGVWYAQPIADGLSSVITLIFLVKELKHLEEAHCAMNPLEEGCAETMVALNILKSQEKL